MKNVKRTLTFFLVIAFIIGFTIPIGIVEAAENNSGYWKLTGKEIHWVEPFIEEKVTYPDDIPWNQEFSAIVNGGEVSTVYTGEEFNFTRTDSCKNWAVPNPSITYIWNPIPEIISPNEKYNLTYESKGDGGNGIVVSGLNDYMVAPWGWGTGSYRDGQKTFTYTAPDAPRQGDSLKKKITVHCSSGGSGTGTMNYVNYIYVYDWVNVEASITSIKVEPANIIFTDKTPKSIKITATMSDGSKKDITSDVNTDYEVDDAEVATVSSTGLVKISQGAQNGDTATIEINNGDAAATCNVKIAIASAKLIKSTISSVVLQSVPGKNTKQLKIIAVMQNNKQEDITKKVSYVSSNPNNFTVNANGLLTVKAGTAKGKTGYVTVNYAGKSCKINIKVK